MALSTALSQQFNPQDLEILDRVYALAPLHLVARDLCSTKEEDPEEIAALRKQVFALAGSGPVNFDALSDKVLTTLVYTGQSYSLATGTEYARAPTSAMEQPCSEFGGERPETV